MLIVSLRSPALAACAVVVAAFVVSCATPTAPEPVRLFTCGFEQDADGDGAAAPWNRWVNLTDPMVDEKPTFWLETEDKVEGTSAQACCVPKQKAGLTFGTHPFEPALNCRVTIWVKVRRGTVIAQGVGSLSGFGWHVLTPGNAGEWTQLREEFRTGRWSMTGGLAVFANADDTEFLIDGVTVDRLSEVEGRTPPVPFPAGLQAKRVGPEKKLIACGSSCPTIRYARDHVREIELAPFDGTALRVNYEFANQFFSRSRVSEDVVRRAVADLKAAPFRKYTDNFIWCNAVPDAPSDSPDYHGDWFNDEWWAVICHNAESAARIAGEGGLKGIVFDTEHYHGRVFDYQKQKQKSEMSYAECAAKARQRGREFMDAMVAVYPGITVLALMAPSYAADDLWHDPNLTIEQTEFSLIVPFWDGMIEASTPDAKLVDGFERTYNFTEYHQFLTAYDLIRSDTAQLSAFPDRYTARTTAAFGIALPWHSAAQLEAATRYALHVSDRYVWVWSDYSCNWAIGRVPRDRAGAMFNARKPVDGPGRMDTAALPERWNGRGTDHGTELLAAGHRIVPVGRLGYVDADHDPTSGVAVFPLTSAAFDYNQRSIVLDFARPEAVDAIHLTATPMRNGASRLNAGNMSLYCSDDNRRYRLVEAEFRKLDTHTVGFLDIGERARYFKLHTTVADTSNQYEFCIGTGHAYRGSGAAAFRKEP